MGAEESHIPLQPVPQSFGYLAVVFKMPDNIQVIHGGEAEHSVIEHVISNTWKEGIQGTKRKCIGSVLCFKLNGLPFEPGILSMNIREVACQLLQHLHNIGWQYLVATNLTKCRQWFTLIFVRKETQRISHELAYVALSSIDKVHFWNLQQHTRDDISHVLHSEYQSGVTFAETTDGCKNYEVQLNGLPWSPTTSVHAEARGTLINIFAVMLKRYRFLCAINVKRTQDAFVFIPKPIHSNTTAEFFIMSLRKTSKIQVFKAPDDLIPIIHSTLLDAFGVMSHTVEKTIDHLSGKVQFKYEFQTASDPSAQCAFTKFIVCKVLEALKGQGWSTVTGFDMTRGLSNKCELLFQKCSPHPECKVFCLSPVRKSKLCVINGPAKIISACRKIIATRWHLPLISETHYVSPAACVSFELGGKPWSDSDDCAYVCHSMLCHLLEEFFHKGFKINLTADVIPESMEYAKGASTSHDPNAWWFMHEPEIVVPAASPVRELKSEEELVPRLAQILSDDVCQPPVPDEHVFLNEPQPPTTCPMMPIYEDSPPSYEMVMMEREQKQD